MVSDETTKETLQKELNTIASLARLDLETEGACLITATVPQDAIAHPASYVLTVVAEGVSVYLPLAGIVDPVKESGRLQKQSGKLEKEITSLAGRLGSPKFIEKAPADVVAKSQGELDEINERLKSVTERLETMKALAKA